MNRNVTLVTLAALVGSLAAACGPTQEEIANGDDPIAALDSTVTSSRYGPTYWTEQMKGDTDVWSEALAYCEPAEHANYPNCEVVRSTKFVGVPGRVENPALSDEGFNP